MEAMEAIAIEVGDSQIRGGMVTHKGNNIIAFPARDDQSLGDRPDVDATLERIRGVAEAILRSAETAKGKSFGWADVAGIGIAIPDAVDEAGNLGQCTTLMGWDGLPIQQFLEATFPEVDPSHIAVLNDANSAALGEAEYGRGKNESSIDLVHFIITAGIGAGIVLGGRLRVGASGYAGEWGHVVVDPTGPQCTGCLVQKGCLEAVASGTAMARRAAEVIERGQGNAMFELVARRMEAERQGRSQVLYNGGGSAQFYTDMIDGGSTCTIWASEVVAAAAAGEPAAREIVVAAGQGLGKAIVQALHILNPDMIVVGGITSRISQLYFSEAEKWAIDHALSSARQVARILPSSLQDHGSILGAAAAVFATFPQKEDSQSSST